jgi:hypothetical protein
MALQLIKLMLLLGVTGLVSAPAAHAVVYCKTVGVPKGCVARPGAAGVGAGAPGVGVAPGAGVGAPGVGVAPANRGGPVNRAGVR